VGFINSSTFLLNPAYNVLSALQTLVKHQEKTFPLKLYQLFFLFLGVVFWFLYFLVCKYDDGFVTLLSSITFLIGCTCLAIFFPDLYYFRYLLCFQRCTKLKIQGWGSADFLGGQCFSTKLIGGPLC
jgi:hypothetical protein